MRSRPPVSDNIFCNLVSTNVEIHQYIVDIRRALAFCCKIPPESIRHDDIFEEIADMMTWTGWDELALILALNIVSGRTYAYDQGQMNFPNLTRRTFLGWTLHPGIPMIEWINRALPELQRLDKTKPSGTIVSANTKTSQW